MMMNWVYWNSWREGDEGHLMSLLAYEHNNFEMKTYLNCYQTYHPDNIIHLLVQNQLNMLIYLILLPTQILACTSAYCTNGYYYGDYYSGSYYCYSCSAHAFLHDNCCYSCDQCQNYSACDSCSTVYSATSIYTIAYIVSGVICGISLIILIRCCLLRCQGEDINNDPPAIQNNLSSNELAPPAAPLSWKKSERMRINRLQACAICLQANVDTLTKCCHPYHLSCISEWCRRKQTNCPLCKNTDIQPLQLFCVRCGQSSLQVLISSSISRNGRQCEECRIKFQGIQSGQIIVQVQN